VQAYFTFLQLLAHFFKNSYNVRTTAMSESIQRATFLVRFVGPKT
jgi:hypothetical protein